MGKPFDQNQTTCYYFGDIIVDKKDKTCRDLKICKFVSIELQKIQHKSVDSDSDLQLKINKELSVNNVENNTFA